VLLSRYIVLNRVKQAKFALEAREKIISSIEPGVNVLLGRNGFGKSLLLRLLVGMITYDDDRLTGMLLNIDKEQELMVG
jgi:ABC-type cobalamin/Fe3+-siderophores transport system ATPase subunit